MATRKTDEQQTLPGVPEPASTKIPLYRVNYQFQGPHYQLRQGSLMIPADTIAQARMVANDSLKNQYGDKWFNITAIKLHINPEEAPF